VKKLVILTLEYPFGNGESFLSNELDFYSKQKVKIILVPFKTEGPRRPLPPGIELYLNDKSLGWLKILSEVISQPWLWKEVIKFFHYLIYPESLILFLFFIKATVVMKMKLAELNSDNLLDSRDTILYSYWLGGLTGGAILFNQRQMKSFKIVSRAHGGDVYEHRYRPLYIPFRELILRNVDYIATVSQDGVDYLKSKYADLIKKISCHYLGTLAPGFVCQASKDGVLRIVSCAHVSPVKRLHLIVESLVVFQNLFPEIKVHWTHLGGGAQLNVLIKQASALGRSVSCSFLGNQTPQQIIQFYQDNQVDIFLNTSVSEGMPVSIMEAMSVGIPILATDVGGVKEMVSESCGKLLPRDLSPAQLAVELQDWMIKDKSKQRANSISKWAALFNAEKNYLEFYESIAGLN
jgi:glycosyltransferase involved in cell wall biosynthesis